MDSVERLIAIHQIEQLKARYFRCMDMKDWAGLERLFTPDLVADFRESTDPPNEELLVEGAARYVAGLAPILEPITTVHHGHTPEIEIVSDIHATGIWAMEDMLWAGEGSAMPWRRMHGYGHYHEEYRRQHGEWRISRIRLSRIRVETA